MKNSFSSFLTLTLALTLTIITSSISFAAGGYIWNGGTSTAWGTAANWTPSGVPGSTDTVTIVTGSRNCVISANTSVKVLTVNSGLLDLNGYKLSISSTCTFNAGVVKPGKLSISGSAVTTFKGTEIQAVVNVKSFSIYLNGSIFQDTVKIVKTSDSNDNSKGGNTFNGYVSLVDSGAGALVLSDSFPDIFNAKVTVNNISTGGIYLAHRGTGNQFKDDVNMLGQKIYSNYYGTATYSGNIYFDSPKGDIYFGYSTGSSSLASAKKITASGTSFSAGSLYFRNFTMLNASDTLALILTSTAKLYFESGSAFYGPVICSAPQLYLNGAKFNSLATLKNTGASTVTSNGGCYFGGVTTIENNSTSSSLFFSLANTTADTFATTSTIKNTRGFLSCNYLYAVGGITLINLDSSSTDSKFLLSTTGTARFKGSLTIDNHGSAMLFGKDGGTTVLDSSQSFSIVSGFSGTLMLSQYSQHGRNSQTFNLGASGSKLKLGPSTIFEGDFDFYGQNIELNGTTFNGATTIKKYSSTANTSNGGNIFNGTTTICDSSSTAHNFILANSAADDYNGNVAFVQKGSGVKLYPAYTQSSTFAGSISVDGDAAINFGANGGKVILDGTSSQTISKNGSYSPVFKKIKVNKAVGEVLLNTSLTLTDSLFFTKGIITSDTSNFITINHGGKVTGASDSSLVTGPIKKIGNAAFVFPVGYNGTNGYHPLEITAPSMNTDAYTAEYVHSGQILGGGLDTTIEHLNTGQYWKLNRNAGTSKVRVSLNWNKDSSKYSIINPAYMRVVGWNGSIWKDFGSSGYSGDSLKGNTISLDSTTTIGKFTIANKRCIYFKGFATKTDEHCPGSGDGVARVTVDGGTIPYQYSWSSGNGNQKSTPILFPGTYSVTVTDSLNCHLSDTISLGSPAPISLSFQKALSTCGDSTGSINVTVSGGAGIKRRYLWNDGDTSKNRINIPAGDYSILVTDSFGCSAVSFVQLSDTNGPIVSLLSMTPVTCFNGNNGEIELDVTGSGPYLYKWSRSTGDTLKDLEKLKAGFYSFKVKDVNECLTYDTFEVTQPDTFSVNINIKNTRCGLHEGKATAIAFGGTAPYSYKWSLSDTLNSYEIDSLNSRNETLVVTDANNCTTRKEYDILDSSGISLASNIISEVVCFPDIGGAAYVTASGGTAPYTYSWFPSGGSNDTAINLLSDNYSILVIDSLGCRQKTALTMTSPDKLEVYPIILTSPSSDTSFDGSAFAYAFGGTPPYSFLWSDNTSSDLLTGTGTGEKIVTLTDNNGCAVKNSISMHVNNCYLGANAATRPCGPYSWTCPDCSSGYVERNIKFHFGAIGDGVSDDECAFEKASDFFNSIDQNVVKRLIIPYGTYKVGKQDAPWTGVGNVVLFFNNINNMTVQGISSSGAKPILKFNPCLLYGEFDDPLNPVNRVMTCYDNPCTTSLYCKTLTPGTMVSFTGCNNSTLMNLELDGSLDEIAIGGGYTEGMQIPYDGIFINASNNMTIANMQVHHFGHDGLTIYYLLCGDIPVFTPVLTGYTLAQWIIDNRFNNAPLMNLTVDGSKFEYCGRNGMTWGGGIGLHVSKSQFNYSGISRLASAPAAGVDIEFEASNIANRSGDFTSCEFNFNRTYGIICANSAPPKNTEFYNRDVIFRDCDFRTGEHGNNAYTNARNFEYRDSRFYGKVEKAFFAPLGIRRQIPQYGNNNFDNTRFFNCEFTDLYNGFAHAAIAETDALLHPLATCPVPDHPYLVNFGTACRVVLQDCKMETHFFFKELRLSADVAHLVNGFSYNVMQDNTFNNYGVNDCGCDANLSAVYTTEFKGNHNFYYPRSGPHFWTAIDGSISGTTLVVSAITGGTQFIIANNVVNLGAIIGIPFVAPNIARITRFVSGTPGGLGTYDIEWLPNITPVNYPANTSIALNCGEFSHTLSGVFTGTATYSGINTTYNSIQAPLPKYTDYIDPKWEKLFSDVPDGCPVVAYASADINVNPNLITITKFVKGTVNDINPNDEIIDGIPLNPLCSLISINAGPPLTCIITCTLTSSFTDRMLTFFENGVDIDETYEPTNPHYCISYRKRSQSVKEEHQLSFNCYPNPAFDKLIIANAQENSELKVTNLQGLLELKIRVNSSDQTININELSLGVYFIYDEFGNVQKFIKI